MKFICSTALILLMLSPFAFSKSRLGEYYYGFGYSMLDGGKDGMNTEGDVLHLSANSLASDYADFKLYLDYANVEVGAQDKTSWNLGLDYIRRFDDFSLADGMLRPFIGGGIGYLKDNAQVRLIEDGFTWSILGGTEIMFTDELSLSIGGRLLGAWKEFSSTDFSFDLGLSWWIDDVHGVAFEYSHTMESEIDFIGLKYLYSWQ